MFEANPSPSAAPVACSTTAVPEEERQRWLDIGREVYAAVTEVQEADDGYACRLPGDARTLRTVAEHVSRDRMCCAFLRWTIRVEPDGGDIWLLITGSKAAKELLRATFESTDALPLFVAQRAGFDTSRRASVELASVDATADRLNEVARRVE